MVFRVETTCWQLVLEVLADPNAIRKVWLISAEFTEDGTFLGQPSIAA